MGKVLLYHISLNKRQVSDKNSKLFLFGSYIKPETQLSTVNPNNVIEHFNANMQILTFLPNLEIKQRSLAQ